MGSTFLFYEEFLCDTLYRRRNSIPPHPRSDDDLEPKTSVWNPTNQAFIWNDSPTTHGIIFYSVVTTIICTFGIFGNSLSLMVMRRKKLVGSVYTYLSVLAATDLSLSIIFFLGGLSRGAFYYTPWSTYDALIGLPLSGAINSLNVLATVAVTVDRVMYLWNPMQLSRPKFCNPKIARELMTASFILSVVLNLPYCFIFAWNDSGELVTSRFFESRTYALFNWLMLIFFAIIPGVFLTLGNGFLIMTLHKSQKITAKCNGRRRNNRNLTIVLITIIIFFLISEIPSNIVSRTRASSILYFGKPGNLDSITLVIVRQICTVLGAINVTVSFLVYFLVCPVFFRAMTETLMKKKKIRDVQVNVFVLREKKIPSILTKIYDMRTVEEPPICFKTRNALNLPVRQLPEESKYLEIIEADVENLRKCINSSHLNMKTT